MATAVPTSRPSSARPTASPTAPATSTPGAAYPVAPAFVRAIHDYPSAFMGAVLHNDPGAPVEAARETKLSEQSFGPYSNGDCGSKDSSFVWREDTRQIYLLPSGSTGLHFESCLDFWQVFPDEWKPGDPNNEDLTAPAGSVVPRGGIGLVWRRRFYGKVPLGLGFPSAPERYEVGTVQKFERATAIYFPDTRAVYVLFDRYRFVTRGGELEGKVWFRAD